MIYQVSYDIVTNICLALMLLVPKYSFPFVYTANTHISLNSYIFQIDLLIIYRNDRYKSDHHVRVCVCLIVFLYRVKTMYVLYVYEIWEETPLG